MAESWSRVPREIVEPLSMELLKPHLSKPLGKLLELLPPVGLDDLWRSLPTPASLWFCEMFIWILLYFMCLCWPSTVLLWTHIPVWPKDFKHSRSLTFSWVSWAKSWLYQTHRQNAIYYSRVSSFLFLNKCNISLFYLWKTFWDKRSAFSHAEQLH